MAEKIETFTVQRSGQPPLQFEGRQIAEADGRRWGGEGLKKPWELWYVVRIFEISEKPGEFVVTVEHHSTVRGVTVHYFAIATKQPAEALRKYEPLAVVKGFPEGPKYDNLQSRLEFDMRAMYDALVSDVLQSFPERLS